jgi:ribosomal-protein-alanine N-acetyltransferase
VLESTYQIRTVEERELDQVENINLRCLPENYSRFFYLDILHRFPKTFLVAIKNGVVSGYIMCRVERGFSELRRFGISKKGHIVSVAVLPEHQRKGIGEALVEKALEGMYFYGVGESYLEVRIGNKPAIDLYDKLGFKVIRRIVGYYRDGEDAYVMAKKR